MNDPGEKWETCPYDKSHELLQSRMQQHLDKCKLQYTGLEKTTCRFNSTHVINKVEYACHIKICPDRVIEDTFVMRVGAESRPVGLLPVENVNVNYHDADECGDDEELVQPRVSPAPVGPSAQTLPIPQELKKTNAPPPDVVEPKFVHDTPQPSSTYYVPSNPWTGSTFAAPQVDNTQDFPTLGTKGPRRDNGNGLQDSLNHLSLNDKPNAWGRPAPRQQDARISVPSTGSSVGSGNRSFGNPWSNRSQQATRSDPSGPSEFDSPSVTSVTKDDFPSLSTSGYGRGRRQRN